MNSLGKRKEKQKGKKRKKKRVRRKGKEKRKMEDFPALRRSELDGPSTKVGTRNAICVWTPKT